MDSQHSHQRKFATSAVVALVFVVIISLGYGLWLPRDGASAAAQGASEEANAEKELVSPGGGDVVLLISLDGFSGSYLNAQDAPRLFSLKDQAYYSTDLVPAFPSLTFPTHVTLATGRPVSGHGIPSNIFFDRDRQESLRFPGDATLLRAEPIWTTAARQGLRVLSYDWPLSHRQQGPHVTTYFEQRFDASYKDAERLNRVFELWEGDPDRELGQGGLRLITAYVKEVDTVGHAHGPAAELTRESVRAQDALLEETVHRAQQIFERHREPGAELYVVLVADHGMAPVTHYVNIDLLVGASLADKVLSASGGNISNLYLTEAGRIDAEGTLAELDAALADLPFGKVYSAETLPAAWGYEAEGRVGERVVVLDPGYTFHRGSLIKVSTVERFPGPRGMHGYLYDSVPEMAGVLMILRPSRPFAQGTDLGRVLSTQLHATISRLLAIEPAAGADQRAIELD